MGTLTKPALDELLAAGCSCGGVKLAFSAYLDGRFTLLTGDQFGPVTWVYKGETFVDGVYEVTCVACKKGVFASSVCPRCHADDALDRVLTTPNRLALLPACPSCQSEKLTYTVMLPAHVVYEGKRAQKARATIDLVEDGAHGVRLECKACGVLEATPRCPLCDAPGPLRERPD